MEQAKKLLTKCRKIFSDMDPTTIMDIEEPYADIYGRPK